MADKRIQDLVEASSVQLADLFVLEQAGTAKKLTGQTLVNDLAAALDGHGGIADIAYSPPVSPSLSGTLTITMADESTYTLTVTNGRGISGLTWTESGDAGNGRVHTGTFEYSDGTESTVQIQDGLKGDQGDQTFVWFKWAQVYPTQDSDLQNNAGPYIGVYAGPAATAPTDYSAYVWYEYKGATGDAGASVSGISLVSRNGLVDTYEIQLTDGSTGGTFTVTNALSIVRIDPPDNPGLPGVTDIYTVVFNDGSTSFFVVYNGTNGTGSVSTVSGLQPNNGDVPQVVILTSAPTTSTPGQENQLAWDALNKQLYYCAGEVSGSYVWYGVSGNITVDASLSNSSTNPVQNKVITGKVGTSALNTAAQDLSGAVNELLSGIPSPSSVIPQKDGTGAAGTGTTWARSNHVHPLNVPASGTPADLGTPSNGSASSYARSNHVHKMPSASDVGALPANTTFVSSVNGLSGAVTIPLPDEGSDYIKFPDGMLICWGTKTYSFSSKTGTASGNLYYYEFIETIPFPVNFVSAPSVSVTKAGGTEVAVSYLERSTSGIAEVDFLGGRASLGSSSIAINWLAIGKWK